MTGGGPPIAPLSPELRHYTAYPDLRPEATWAQPLGPGRAVLTRGVSRRSGSVACIRADASPTEVLAHPSCMATLGSSNSLPNHRDFPGPITERALSAKSRRRIHTVIATSVVLGVAM